MARRFIQSSQSFVAIGCILDVGGVGLCGTKDAKKGGCDTKIEIGYWGTKCTTEMEATRRYLKISVGAHFEAIAELCRPWW